MAPGSRFGGTGFQESVDQGVEYQCPQCGAKVPIRDTGALLSGGLISAFWLAIGGWALWAGPLWYLRNARYFAGENDFDLYLFDGILSLLAVGVFAVACWYAWTEFLAPLRNVRRHPVAGRLREPTADERREQSRARRTLVLSVLVLPLGLWAVLLVAIWLLSLTGLDLRENTAVKYIAVAVLVGAVFSLGRKSRINAPLLMAGMAGWLAVFVAVIFMF